MMAVSRRYARAAVEAAGVGGDAASLATLVAGLNAFRDAYHASSEFRAILSHPGFARERLRVVRAIATKMQLSPVTERLLRKLTSADRIAQIDEVAAEVQRLVNAQQGRVLARVRSVIPLTKEQRHRIEQALEPRIGRKVELEVVVDPEILGGLVCQVGDLTFDNSLKRQLQTLREQLESPAVG